MSEFNPLSRDRVEQIKRAISSSEADGRALAFDSKTGECAGPVQVVTPTPDDRRNVISRFDTHYKA